MKALISSIEPRETGYRVAQVEDDANIFGVADEMFWVDCSSDCVADMFWYDPSDNTIKPIPEPKVVAAQDQATVSGAEQL